MKIDTLNSSYPAAELPVSENNSDSPAPAITAKHSWTAKNDLPTQADDSGGSASYASSATQTSPAKNRTARAEQEPVLMAGEPWADFQERHYRWRLNIPGNEPIDRKLIPEDEGVIPPRSIKEALIEGVIGLVMGGPGAGVRPGAPTLGGKPMPAPKLVPNPKPGTRPRTSSSSISTPSSPPSTSSSLPASSSSLPTPPGSRPGVPGSRPDPSASGISSSRPSAATSSSSLDPPGSRPGVPNSRPSPSASDPARPYAPAPGSGLETPGTRPSILSSRSQASGITLPTSPDALQTFALNNGKVSFAGKDKGYIYKGIVFRGDTRTPETIFNEGFRLRTKINDINEINGYRGGFGGGRDALDPDGKGISTSGFYKKDGAGAYYYGGNKGGYTYVIDGANMEGYHLYQNRHFAEHPNDSRVVLKPLEINYGRDIPADHVIGAFDQNGHFIQNPNYRGKFQVPPPQQPHHHYSEQQTPHPQAQPIPHPEIEPQPQLPPQPQPQPEPQPQPQPHHHHHHYGQESSHHQHSIPNFDSPNPHGWTGQPITDSFNS